MKKSLILTIILILSGCAKAKTTPYFSTQGQIIIGPPITSVLTNPDYAKQQQDKYDQEAFELLYQSYEAEEAQENNPEPSTQKTLGRLTCTKKSERFNCTLEPVQSDANNLSDQALYDALTLPEVLDEHSNEETKTYLKQSGRFYCEKTINISTDETQYHCAMRTLYTNKSID